MIVALRAPSSLPAAEPSASLAPPSLEWLSGSWNVTHSTLPMWRKNRNVRITYTPLAGTSPPHLDDLVTYQPLSSSSLKTVRGVDKPFAVSNTAEPSEGAAVASLGYHWRGKGWLMIASSTWEILAHGAEESTGNAFVVTYFAKTLFTPAGLDIYSRKGRLKSETVESIKAALAGLGGDTAKLAAAMFEIAMDHDREN